MSRKKWNTKHPRMGRKAYPLRKVIGWRSDENGLLWERLKCGHEQQRRQDFIGPTNAARRRCRQCAQSKSPPCEVCGAPSTHAVRDLIEDRSGEQSPFIRMLPAGPRPRFYCDEHQRGSEVVGIIGPHF